MKKYDYCFFDLDGTVIDSASGVTGCVRYALEKLGVPAAPERDLTCFIGPTLHYGFSTFCELNEVDTDRAVALYREKYSAGGLFDCRVYDGLEETLRELTARGVICVLATCKPYTYANRILAHLGLDKYFSFVSGPELSGVRNEKHEVIAYALEQLRIPSSSRVLMVGDRASDVTGARQNNIDTVGVSWGFGTREELEAAKAYAVIDTPQELLQFF